MSDIRSDVAVGVTIARGELRDLIRRNNTRRQRVALGLLVVLMVPLWLSFVRQGYALGVETGDGVDANVVGAARNLLFPALLIVALFGGLGAAQSLARDAVRPLVLTTASTRAVVVGKVLYLLATWLLVLGLTALPVVAYIAGARAPLFFVALVVGLLPLLLLTMGVGLLLAYLLWLGIERLGLPEVTRRLVTASLSVVAFLAAFALGTSIGRTTGTPGGLADLPTGEPLTPLGWYADLLFVGSPMAASVGARTGLAALFVGVAVPLVFAALVRVAPAYWYATPEEEAGTRAPSGEVPEFERTPSRAVGRGDGLLGRRQTFRAALGYVRGAVRRPDQYVYLFYYLFPVAMVLVPVVVNLPDAIPAAAGAGLVLLGVWFAGSVFCLNPLGTEGAMLSQLVLARTPAATFVHARLLAGVGLGGAFSGVGVALVVAWGVGVPPLSPAALATALLVVATLLVTLTTSACVALGVGSVLPKFETAEVFDSVETLVPSLFAAIIHGLVAIAVASTAALVALTLAPGNPLSVPRWLAALAGGLFVLAAFVLADGSRRYAVARLRDYGHERARPDRTFVVYAAFGLAALSLVLGQVTALSAVVVLGVDTSVGVLLPVLFVVEYLGSVIVVLGFLYLTRRGLAYLDLRWPSPRELGLVVVGLGALLALQAVTATAIEGLGLPSAEHTLFDTEDGDPALLLVLVPLVLLVNGPVEELLYRNVIQKYLTERFTTAAAVGLTSLVFALAHVPAYLTADIAAIGTTLALLFGLSCVLGALYARTGSLPVVAAVHGLYNATLVAVLYVSVA